MANNVFTNDDDGASFQQSNAKNGPFTITQDQFEKLVNLLQKNS